MAAAVLLAESEPGTRSLLERQLINDGFAVLREPEEGRPHLVLAGDLESVDAWSGEVPVIVLGQEGAGVVERVRAFELGCDDYGEAACPSPSGNAGGRVGPLSCSVASVSVANAEHQRSRLPERVEVMVERGSLFGSGRRVRSGKRFLVNRST